MATTIGQQILHQSDTGRFRAGVIAGNIDGDTADLCVFSDGNTWETMAGPENTSYMRYQKDKGSSVDQWIENPAGLGPKGDTGDPGPGFGTITENTPSRSLGTAFQPSSTRPVLASYSVRVVSALTLTTGQSGRIELRSDANNPPTTVRARVAGGSSGSLSVGISISDTAEGALTYLVPAGHFVLLQSINEISTPTYSITAQSEEVL